MTTTPILETRQVSKRFGGLQALRGVDIAIGAGEIVGLIGPNGAGKTTLFNVITGVHPPDSGAIHFVGRETTRLAAHKICRLGLGRTFQAVRPFLDLTVRQNLVIGARFGGKSRTPGEIDGAVDDALDFVGLQGKADLQPRHLTLVDRKMVEIARALAAKPTLLLLDEALSGLNPSEMAQASALIRRMRDTRGIAIVWVEHVMRALMATCERIIALNFGQVLADGTPAEVSADPAVIVAYLGQKKGGH